MGSCSFARIAGLLKYRLSSLPKKVMGFDKKNIEQNVYCSSKWMKSSENVYNYAIKVETEKIVENAESGSDWETLQVCVVMYVDFFL